MQTYDFLFTTLSLGLSVSGVALITGSYAHRKLMQRVHDLERLVSEGGELDELTMCYRRGPGERLTKLALRAYPCTVVFIDLNDFKAVNDGPGGHAAGDEKLRVVGESLRTTFAREHDIVVRWGGDEFVLILPALPRDAEPVMDGRRPMGQEHYPLDTLLEYAERKLDVLAVRHDFTFGLVTTPRMVNPDSAIRAADTLMYEKKRRFKMLREAHNDILTPVIQGGESP